MILHRGLEKVAQYIDSLMSHAVVFSSGTQTQVNFYQKTIDGRKVEIWIQVPDNIERIDKIQIIDTDGDVFLERNKVLTRRQGRALIEVFTLDVREVSA